MSQSVKKSMDHYQQRFRVKALWDLASFNCAQKSTEETDGLKEELKRPSMSTVSSNLWIEGVSYNTICLPSTIQFASPGTSNTTHISLQVISTGHMIRWSKVSQLFYPKPLLIEGSWCELCCCCSHRTWACCWACCCWTINSSVYYSRWIWHLKFG